MIRILRAGGLLVIGLLLLPAGNARPRRFGNPYNNAPVTAPTPYWGYTRHPYHPAGRSADAAKRAMQTQLKTKEKAARKRERLREAKLKARRHDLDKIKWPRHPLHKMGREEAKSTIEKEEKRAREEPPLTDMLDGDSLNEKLDELGDDAEEPGKASESVAVEQAWLVEINFVGLRGSAILLKHEEFTWPVLLQAKALTLARERVEKLLEKAREDLKKGKVSHDTIEGLLEAHKSLDEGATAEVMRKGAVWGPTHHVLAIRFLRELKATILLLQHPLEAALLLKRVPDCKTVAEFVRYLRINKLKIGPAFPGSERSYAKLFKALLAEAKRRAEKKPGAS